MKTETRERPILFSAPMVRAILDGQKTQTRRVVDFKKIAKKTGCTRGRLAWSKLLNNWAVFDGNGDADLCEVDCPYGKTGDLLWVRETWSPEYIYREIAPREIPVFSDIWYWADGDPTAGDWARPKPSIHMPNWARRIMLRIVNVRMERVQDISKADAEAEGVQSYYVSGIYSHGEKGCISRDSELTNIDRFSHLWNSINASRGHGWDANPWVWVIEFKRV